MGMTMAEKVLASHSGNERVVPGQIVVAKIDRTRIVDIQGPLIEETFNRLGIKRFWDCNKVFLPIEHQVPPSTVHDAESYAACRRIAKNMALSNFYDIGRHGTCHQLFIEKGFARPGELVAAGDSHTCIYGALNCAARGIGEVDMLYLLCYGKLWFKVPESIKVVCTGKLPFGVYSKDLILYIAGKYGSDMGRYCSLEFYGDTIDSLSIPARMTISNMGIELGAKFALFPYDDKVKKFLADKVHEPYTPVYADDDAIYKQVIEIDSTSLEPYVACPHDLSNSKPLKEVAGTRIDQAFVGSCANGSIEDLRITAGILKGRQIADGVRMIIIPTSMTIYRQAMKEGLFDIFLDAGAVIETPTCGPCGGGSKGVLAAGERCISTSTRNFKGRMGSPQAEIYLATPASVAASAITGVITDPRPFLKGGNGDE